MNTPTQNILATLVGKKALFLENDGCLENGLDELERILNEGKIENTKILNLSEQPLESIVKAINLHDTIIFQTRWQTDIAEKLINHIKGLEEKKIIIECYISEPTWYYASQHGSHHDVFIYTCLTSFGKAKKWSEKFHKLTDTAFWDYENKFDK